MLRNSQEKELWKEKWKAKIGSALVTDYST